MITALLVLAILAVVLGAAGVLLVLRHRTHLRSAAARLRLPGTGRIRTEPTR